MKGYYLFPTVIILFFIAWSLSTSVSLSPYTKKNIYKNFHAYEGFSSKIGYANTDVPAKGASVPTVAAQNHPEYNNKKKTGCKKLFGFEGLYCDPRDEGEKLDYFSNAKGELLDCQGSGLSNSQGSLCFDKTMINLLTTRGGNAKGGDAQIGF